MFSFVLASHAYSHDSCLWLSYGCSAFPTHYVLDTPPLQTDIKSRLHCHHLIITPWSKSQGYSYLIFSSLCDFCRSCPPITPMPYQRGPRTTGRSWKTWDQGICVDWWIISQVQAIQGQVPGIWPISTNGNYSSASLQTSQNGQRAGAVRSNTNKTTDPFILKCLRNCSYHFIKKH